MSILGSVVGAIAGNKGAKKSAKYQVEVAKMNNSLAREFRAENTANLSPFMQRGNAAGDAMNALLGLPGGYGGTNGQGMTQAQQVSGILPEIGPNRTAQYHLWLTSNPNATDQQKLDFIRGIAHPDELQMIEANMRQAPGYSSGVTANSAQNAFDNYRGSTGYQFRVDQGMNALNNGYAAQGALRSGKAQKDVMRFGQGIASDEFGRYMGYLGNQQGVGLQGASAIAGVSSNALGAMTNNNQNAADARSNAALIKGNNNQQMWAQIDEQLSSIGSSFGGGM